MYDLSFSPLLWSSLLRNMSLDLSATNINRQKNIGGESGVTKCPNPPNHKSNPVMLETSRYIVIFVKGGCGQSRKKLRLFSSMINNVTHYCLNIVRSDSFH
jgi:hypothetical protein